MNGTSRRPSGPGTMAAVIGLELEQLEALCRTASEAGLVAPANLNTLRRSSCPARSAASSGLMELAKEAGADKVGATPGRRCLPQRSSCSHAGERWPRRWRTSRERSSVRMASNASGAWLRPAPTYVRRSSRRLRAPCAGWSVRTPSQAPVASCTSSSDRGAFSAGSSGRRSGWRRMRRRPTHRSDSRRSSRRTAATAD